MLANVTFCAFLTFLNPGDKNGQKVTKRDIAVRAKQMPKMNITRLGSALSVFASNIL